MDRNNLGLHFSGVSKKKPVKKPSVNSDLKAKYTERVQMVSQKISDNVEDVKLIKQDLNELNIRVEKLENAPAAEPVKVEVPVVDDSLKNEVSELSSRINEAQKETANVKEEVVNVKEQCAYVKKQTQDVKSDFGNLVKRVEMLESAPVPEVAPAPIVEKVIEKVEVPVPTPVVDESVKEDIDSIKQEMQSVKETSDSVKSEMESIKETSDSVKSQIESVKEECASFAKKLEVLEKMEKHTEAVVSHVPTAAPVAGGDNLMEEITDTKREFRKLVDRVRVLETAKVTMETEMAKIKENPEVPSTEGDAGTTEDVSGLKKACEAAKFEAAVVREECENIKREFRKLGDRVRVLEGNPNPTPVETPAPVVDETTKADIEAIKTDSAAIKADIEAVRNESTSVKADIEAVKNDSSIVKSDLEVVKLENSTVKADLEEIKIEISSLKEDISANKEAEPIRVEVPVPVQAPIQVPVSVPVNNYKEECKKLAEKLDIMTSLYMKLAERIEKVETIQSESDSFLQIEEIGAVDVADESKELFDKLNAVGDIVFEDEPEVEQVELPKQPEIDVDKLKEDIVNEVLSSDAIKDMVEQKVTACVTTCVADAVAAIEPVKVEAEAPEAPQIDEAAIVEIVRKSISDSKIEIENAISENVDKKVETQLELVVEKLKTISLENAVVAPVVPVVPEITTPDAASSHVASAVSTEVAVKDIKDVTPVIARGDIVVYRDKARQDFNNWGLWIVKGVQDTGDKYTSSVELYLFDQHAGAEIKRVRLDEFKRLFEKVECNNYLSKEEREAEYNKEAEINRRLDEEELRREEAHEKLPVGRVITTMK